MADLIKFKCKCGKKIGVRPEYAGKKAKCPGCSQPIRVPSPRPKRAAAASGAPVAAGGGTGFLGDGGSSNSNSLYELAEMEKNAETEVAEMTTRLGARAGIAEVTNGKDCPGCGTMVKQDAVVCVHCGYNYDTGKRLKTKKRKAEKDTNAPVSNYRERESSGGVMTSGLWRWGSSALIFGGLGIAVMARVIEPSGGGRRNRWIGSLYESTGPYVTGGVLLAVAVVCGVIAISSSE